ncbi:hypothetical protein PFISCL1PPCAC_18979, partial [Pristionchus fissidentatus]
IELFTFHQIGVDSTSPDFLIILNGRQSRRYLPSSTIDAVIRRIQGHVLEITLAVDPHDISHFDLIETICGNNNKRVNLALKDGDEYAVSRLTLKFDLPLIYRLIKSCTRLRICFICPSLIFDDLIKLHKVIGEHDGELDNFMTSIRLNLAKELAYRFMGVALSYFDQTEPPYFPHFYDRNMQVILNDPRVWMASVEHGNVATSLMRHTSDKFILIIQQSSD